MLSIFSFVGFTFLVAVISYLATRKTNENSSDGYFLGGRSLTAGVIAGSLLLTNLSTEQIVGLNGQAYSNGLSVMAWETLAVIAMVITAIFGGLKAVAISDSTNAIGLLIGGLLIPFFGIMLIGVYYYFS